MAIYLVVQTIFLNILIVYLAFPRQSIRIFRPSVRLDCVDSPFRRLDFLSDCLDSHSSWLYGISDRPLDRL